MSEAPQRPAARAALKPERRDSPLPLPLPVLAGGGAGIVAIIILLIILCVWYRKRHRFSKPMLHSQTDITSPKSNPHTTERTESFTSLCIEDPDADTDSKEEKVVANGSRKQSSKQLTSNASLKMQQPIMNSEDPQNLGFYDINGRNPFLTEEISMQQEESLSVSPKNSPTTKLTEEGEPEVDMEALEGQLSEMRYEAGVLFVENMENDFCPRDSPSVSLLAQVYAADLNLSQWKGYTPNHLITQLIQDPSTHNQTSFPAILTGKSNDNVQVTAPRVSAGEGICEVFTCVQHRQGTADEQATELCGHCIFCFTRDDEQCVALETLLRRYLNFSRKVLDGSYVHILPVLRLIEDRLGELQFDGTYIPPPECEGDRDGILLAVTPHYECTLHDEIHRRRSLRLSSRLGGGSGAVPQQSGLLFAPETLLHILLQILSGILGLQQHGYHADLITTHHVFLDPFCGDGSKKPPFDPFLYTVRISPLPNLLADLKPKSTLKNRGLSTIVNSLLDGHTPNSAFQQGYIDAQVSEVLLPMCSTTLHTQATLHGFINDIFQLMWVDFPDLVRKFASKHHTRSFSMSQELHTTGTSVSDSTVIDVQQPSPTHSNSPDGETETRQPNHIAPGTIQLRPELNSLFSTVSDGPVLSPSFSSGSPHAGANAWDRRDTDEFGSVVMGTFHNLAIPSITHSPDPLTPQVGDGSTCMSSQPTDDDEISISSR
eukprot:TRINITY_DN3836_c0_g1_i1.p1 TRINITY_DN3836_c0_g1~~TRINITY_DN3836_c0_g1_i1.p1  ORF type:complete len:715 (-),score=50.51 TRINITY_DN3836_c0_g1_i1:74-2218(-)